MRSLQKYKSLDESSHEDDDEITIEDNNNNNNENHNNIPLDTIETIEHPIYREDSFEEGEGETTKQGTPTTASKGENSDNQKDNSENNLHNKNPNKNNKKNTLDIEEDNLQIGPSVHYRDRAKAVCYWILKQAKQRWFLIGLLFSSK